MQTDADDRRDQPEQSLPTRLEAHRNGPYLGIDAEAGVEYGDGTPEWMVAALRRRPRGSWCPERDSWHAVRRSWGTDAEDDA